MAEELDIQRFSLFLSLLRQREFRVNAAVRHRNARRRLACYLHRRRLISSLFYLLLTQYIQQVPIREVWRKPRSNSFWQETCGGWADREWIENLRMSRAAFDYLCNELSPYKGSQAFFFLAQLPTNQRGRKIHSHSSTHLVFLLIHETGISIIDMVFKIGHREQFTDMYFPRKDVGDFVHLTKDLVQDVGMFTNIFH